MSSNVLYEEKIFSWGITLILGTFTLLIAVFFAVQLIQGPIGSNPAPNSLLIIYLALFIALTWAFSILKIKLTDQQISVNYGPFGAKRNWSDIVNCKADTGPSFYGWGVRFGKHQGLWVWIFNVMGGPRVAFVTNKTKPRGLIISTKNPQQVIDIALNQIKKPLNNA